VRTRRWRTCAWRRHLSLSRLTPTAPSVRFATARTPCPGIGPTTLRRRRSRLNTIGWYGQILFPAVATVEQVPSRDAVDAEGSRRRVRTRTRLAVQRVRAGSVALIRAGNNTCLARGG
jgi:hypothetical protein